ncbi:MAG: DNA mismatch repair endonuclease MutL [Rubricoccaceae bacterium]
MKRPDPIRGDLPSGPAPDETAADGLIRVMPDVLASKIAAGEVVQRPASAAKELLENALDAGASTIELIVRRAGSDLVQVVDDGSGMGPADAVACFGRHATSKLRSFEDLERLRTLGFRGEALASIASVARVELRTRRRQDATGTCVRVDGGVVSPPEPVAASPGTSVAVRALFYNVPARRAFLKTPATEFRHLVEAFQAIALSHPGVAFRLVHDDNEVYHLPAADGPPGAALRQRVTDLLGAHLEHALVDVGETTSYLSLRGVVGRPEVARRGRGDQYLFVNERAVRSRALETAVAQAFGGMLPEGHHPFFALFLRVDPRHVDVNVHPSKTEIKFDDERGLFSFVRAVVKKGLAETGLAIAFESAPGAVGQAFARMDRPVPGRVPPLATGSEAGLPEHAGPEHVNSQGEEPSGPVLGATPRAWDLPSDVAAGAARAPVGAATGRPLGGSAPPPDPLVHRQVVPGATGEVSARGGGASGEAAGDHAEGPDGAIWQLHGRYLLSPIRSGLLVVDQRAAHERILYESALAALEAGMGLSQQLLFARVVPLGPAERALVEELLPELRALGFELDLDGARGVVVRGVPADVRVGEEQEVLTDLLAQFRRNADTLRLGARDNLARSLARRGAVREGQVLAPAAARALIDQLFACKDPYTDPAGRLTMLRLTQDEFDRRFGRR